MGAVRTKARTGAQALVGQLEAAGVSVVFGIPGVHNLALFEALRHSKIRTVLVRHEQTCVYAADGYARATGDLGVAITTTGPGAANTAAAMGEARASRSPVLHISTQVDSAALEGRSGRFSLHESPHQRQILDPLALWSATVARADAIPSLITRATQEAFVGRRGPVFVDIPHDFLSVPVTRTAAPVAHRRDLVPDPRALERAVAALRDAKRPVIWAGGGAIASDAGDAIAKVAEAIDAPIVTTFAGKGIVPPDHPLLVGFPAHDPDVTKLIASSDAILIVGSDLDGPNTQGWRITLPHPRVALNTIAEDGRRNYACDVVVEADARASLEAMLPLLSVRRGSAAKRVAAVRAKAHATARASKDLAPGYRFIRTVEKEAGDAFVVADMAVAGYWAGGYLRPARARRFAYPLGWGTLGFALPASVGVGASGQRALVLTGDAGALFGIGELATLAQEKLPVTVLVVNDGGYGMLRFDEQERFGETFATDLRAPDFVALAASFGIEAKRCTQKDLGASLRWALGRKGPALLELRAKLAPPITTSPRWPLRGRKEARP